MRFRSPRIPIFVGMFLALMSAEMVIWIVGPLMPDPSPWPTVETDIKSDQLSQMDQEVSLFLLGTSATEAGVDPVLLDRLTGLTSSYNSALPFSSPLSNEIWLEEVLVQDPQPSLLVIGLPAWPPNREVDRLMVKGMQRAVTVSAFAEALEWSALVSKRGVLADWDRLRERDLLERSGLWTDLGHQTGYYDRSGGTVAGGYTVLGALAMSPDQTEALERMIISLSASGVEVVLLVEPGRFPGEATETEVTAYLEWLSGKSIEWGVQLWDAYSIDWDESFFADEVHLNRSGTLAFTAYLADLINDRIAESE